MHLLCFNPIQQLNITQPLILATMKKINYIPAKNSTEAPHQKHQPPQSLTTVAPQNCLLTTKLLKFQEAHHPSLQQDGKWFNNWSGRSTSLGRWDLAKDPTHRRLILEHHPATPAPAQGRRHTPAPLPTCVRSEHLNTRFKLLLTWQQAQIKNENLNPKFPAESLAVA